MKRPEASTDRPTYDQRDEIGEDPFSFLCQSEEVAISRINGVMRFDRLDAYVQCEEQVGPRKNVIAAIYQRKAELEQMEDRQQMADLMTRSVAADGGEENA